MKPAARHRTQSEARSGQVLVVGAFAILVVGIVAALAVDVGYIYCTRARLQNAADAAALAAAQQLAEERNAGSGEATARSAAATEAAALVGANWEAAGWHVAFGAFEEGTFIEQSAETPATAVKVVAGRDEEAPGGALALFFAPLAGVNSVNVSAAGLCSLSAGIRTIRNNSNLMPFAVYEGDVVQAGQTMVIYDHGQVAPGNFGLLNFDGGSMGTPELWDWILHGYPGEVSIDPDVGYAWIDGECGFRTAIRSAIEQRIGDGVIVCVYDDVTGQGANARFRIVRFMGVVLTGCHLTGQDKYIEARVEELVNVPDGEPGGSETNLCLIKLVQ